MVKKEVAKKEVAKKTKLKTNENVKPKSSMESKKNTVKVSQKAVSNVSGTFIIWNNGNQLNIEDIRNITKSKYPKIDISLVNTTDVYNIRDISTNLPDLVINIPNDLIGDIVDQKKVVDITKIFDEKSKKLFDTTSVNSFIYNRKNYGIPLYSERISLLRNKKKIKTPYKDNEFSKLLKDKVQIAYSAPGSDPYHFYPLTTSYGINIFIYNEKTGWTKTIGMNNSSGYEYANKLYSLGKAGYFKPVDYSKCVKDVSDGISWITGPWSKNSLQDINSNLNNYEVDKIPSLGGKPAKVFTGVNGMCMINKSRSSNLQNAFNDIFINLLSKNDNFMKKKSVGQISSKLSLVKLSDSFAIKFYNAQSVNSVPFPSVPNNIWTLWGDTQTYLLNAFSKGINLNTDQITKLWKSMCFNLGLIMKKETFKNLNQILDQLTLPKIDWTSK